MFTLKKTTNFCKTLTKIFKTTLIDLVHIYFIYERFDVSSSSKKGKECPFRKCGIDDFVRVQ